MSIEQLEIPMPDNKWEIKHSGASYEIIFDTGRARLQPAWFVRRLFDGAISKRYYSWPEGAFSALQWNRIEWS